MSTTERNLGYAELLAESRRLDSAAPGKTPGKTRIKLALLSDAATQRFVPFFALYSPGGALTPRSTKAPSTLSNSKSTIAIPHCTSFSLKSS